MIRDSSWKHHIPKIVTIIYNLFKGYSRKSKIWLVSQGKMYVKIIKFNRQLLN